MTRQVSGVLRRADGVPLAGGSLVFRAATLTVAGAPDALIAESVININSVGAYSVVLSPGRYRVAIRWEGNESHVGMIDVTSGATINLPDLVARSIQ